MLEKRWAKSIWPEMIRPGTNISIADLSSAGILTKCRITLPSSWTSMTGNPPSVPVSGVWPPSSGKKRVWSRMTSRILPSSTVLFSLPVPFSLPVLFPLSALSSLAILSSLVILSSLAVLFSLTLCCFSAVFCAVFFCSISFRTARTFASNESAYPSSSKSFFVSLSGIIKTSFFTFPLLFQPCWRLNAFMLPLLFQPYWRL